MRHPCERRRQSNSVRPTAGLVNDNIVAVLHSAHTHRIRRGENCHGPVEIVTYLTFPVGQDFQSSVWTDQSWTRAGLDRRCTTQQECRPVFQGKHRRPVRQTSRSHMDPDSLGTVISDPQEPRRRHEEQAAPPEGDSAGRPKIRVPHEPVHGLGVPLRPPLLDLVWPGHLIEISRLGDDDWYVVSTYDESGSGQGLAQCRLPPLPQRAPRRAEHLDCRPLVRVEHLRFAEIGERHLGEPQPLVGRHDPKRPGSEAKLVAWSLGTEHGQGPIPLDPFNRFVAAAEHTKVDHPVTGINGQAPLGPGAGLDRVLTIAWGLMVLR